MALSGFNNCACPAPIELEQRCFPLRNEENDYPSENSLPEVPEGATADTPFIIPLFNSNYYTRNTYDTFYGNHRIMDVGRRSFQRIANRWLPIFKNINAENPVEITVRNPDADTTGNQIQQAQKFTSNIGFFMPLTSTAPCDITYSFKFLDELDEEITTFSCTWANVSAPTTEYSLDNTYATKKETQIAQETNLNEWYNNYAGIQLPYGRSLRRYYEQDPPETQHTADIALAPDLIHTNSNARYDTKRTFSCNALYKHSASSVCFSLGTGESCSLDPILDDTLYYDYIVILRNNDKVHVYYGEDLKAGKYTRTKNDIYPCNGYSNPQSFAPGKYCYGRRIASRYICSFDMSRYAKMTITVSVKPHTVTSCDVLLDGVSHMSDVEGRGLSFSSIYIPSKARDNAGNEYHPCPYPIQPESQSLLTGRWPAMVRNSFLYKEDAALTERPTYANVYELDSAFTCSTCALTQRFYPNEFGQVRMRLGCTTKIFETLFERIPDLSCTQQQIVTHYDKAGNKIYPISKDIQRGPIKRVTGEITGKAIGSSGSYSCIMRNSRMLISHGSDCSATVFSGTTSSESPYIGLCFLLGPLDYTAVLISYSHTGTYMNPYAFYGSNSCEQAQLYPNPLTEEVNDGFSEEDIKNIFYNKIHIVPTYGTVDIIPPYLTGVIAMDEAHTAMSPNTTIPYKQLKQAAYRTITTSPVCDITNQYSKCEYYSEGYLNSRALQVIEFIMDLSEDKTRYTYNTEGSLSGSSTSNAKLLDGGDIPLTAAPTVSFADNNITYVISSGSGLLEEVERSWFSANIPEITTSIQVDAKYLAQGGLFPFRVFNFWNRLYADHLPCKTQIFEPTTTTITLSTQDSDPTIYLYPSYMWTPKECTQNSCSFGEAPDIRYRYKVCQDTSPTENTLQRANGIPEYHPKLHVFYFIKEAPRSGYLINYPREQSDPIAFVNYDSFNNKKINLPKIIEHLHETLP